MPPIPLKPLAGRIAASIGVMLALPGLALAATPAGAEPDAPDLAGIFAHTPEWVWLVLAGLVWLGLRRTRPRDVGPTGFVLLPLILVALSAWNLMGSGMPMAIVAGAAIGGLVGLAVGLTLERRHPAQWLEPGRLRIAGEWTTLIVVLVVFTIRYARAVLASTDPAVLTLPGIELASAGVSGLLAVMLLTRTLIRLRLAFAPATFAKG